MGGCVEPSPESQIQDELLVKGVIMWDSSLRELTVNFHSWIYSYVLAAECEVQVEVQTLQLG